jgi:hypothetical protein
VWLAGHYGNKPNFATNPHKQGENTAPMASRAGRRRASAQHLPRAVIQGVRKVIHRNPKQPHRIIMPVGNIACVRPCAIGRGCCRWRYGGGETG